jgi:hypothetical protein
MDAIRMLTIKPEQTLEINNELYACFTDWQKVFDHLKQT